MPMSSNIQYYSTNRLSPTVDFKTALLKGLAPDGGLYMPSHIPKMEKSDFVELTGLSYAEIAFKILQNYLADDIPADVLFSIVTDAYDYPVPLENVYDRSWIMRLDQGPTASFKDFAARLMGRLIQFYLKQDDRRMLILTATSGDTGSAIANAFYGLENIEVVILYPRDEVTERQRKQMTTLGRNVSVLAIDGKFDDCQALVKQAFTDSDLAHLPLSSANSINIGRLLPQSVYYVYAWSRLAATPDEKIIFSVPSGNFGDLMGGILAMRMGLPVEKFVVATNTNDEFPIFMQTGDYRIIVPSHNCISSAMNVGHPSNMARLFEIYGGRMNPKGNVIQMPDMELLRRELYAVSASDEQTRHTIREVHQRHQVILEPHGAVGWYGLSRYLAANSYENPLCVSLETAHPAKFPSEIVNALGFDPELPPSLGNLDNKPEYITEITSNYTAFKDYLKARSR